MTGEVYLQEALNQQHNLQLDQIFDKSQKKMHENKLTSSSSSCADNPDSFDSLSPFFPIGC